MVWPASEAEVAIDTSHLHEACDPAEAGDHCGRALEFAPSLEWPSLQSGVLGLSQVSSPAIDTGRCPAQCEDCGGQTCSW